METVLINTGKVVSCWERDNKCLVQMSSGKVWALKPTITLSNNKVISTKQYILSKSNELIELPLNIIDGGTSNG